MDYRDFMKSKRIAERWGEAQAVFESSENSEEIAYYHELLTEFYDYIQHLEAQLFETTPEIQLEQKEQPISEPFSQAIVQVPPIISHFPKNETSPKVSQPINDEEDPWFGFD